MKKILMFIIFILFAIPVYAQSKSLTTEQIERVKAFKSLLVEVDKKTLAKTISELERSTNPQMNLQIQELIAKVYSDIVAAQAIKDQANKQWLYNTVALNMANLQFGGGAGRDPVNRMIVERLKKGLSAEITNNPDFHVSVE